MKTACPTVYEVYEYRGWEITITDKYCDGNLSAFAVRKKYANILNIDNYYWEQEDFEKDGIHEKDWQNGVLYIAFEHDELTPEWGTSKEYDMKLPGLRPVPPVSLLSFTEHEDEGEDDGISVSGWKEVYFIKNRKNSNLLLNFIVNEINIANEEDGDDIIQGDVFVLKEISKYNSRPKTSKRKHKRSYLDQAWASLVKNRDGKCVECGNLNDLHAHHIKSHKTNPELRLDISNGVTLCGHCHREHHRKNGR